jgi:hypothetical protein
VSLSDLVGTKLDETHRDAQLEGSLLKEAAKPEPRRGSHCRLKDLVNPQQIYWELPPRQPPPVPLALEEVWAYGTQMHDTARTAISTLEGYDGCELDLDSAEVGFPGIKGRIDFRLGDRIVEFKTTRYEVSSADDVWRLVPQDIEQLLFYAAIWTRQSSEHLLIFYNDEFRPSIRAFRCYISNLGAVQTIVKQRMAALTRAVQTSNPSILRRCRYFEGICPPKAAGLCSCDKLTPINISPLAEVTTLTRDSPLEAHIESSFQAALTAPRAVRPWDLEILRRTYSARRAQGRPESWVPDPNLWVYDALVSSGVLPGPLDSVPRTSFTEPLPFHCSVVFVRRKSSDGMSSRERFVPTLIRSWEKNGEPSPQRLRPQIMQLGVACSIAGSADGYLVLERPGDLQWVRAFRLSFRDLPEIKREVRRRLQLLADSLRAGSHADLPECEQWIQVEIPCARCLCHVESPAIGAEVTPVSPERDSLE